MRTQGEPILIEPTYGYGRDDLPYRPTLWQTLFEWLDSINFIRTPQRSLIALNFSYHTFTFCMFALFIYRYFSFGKLLFVLATASVIGTIYNTVWQHRYCSHAAFTFKRDWYNWIFLLSNPLVFRDESFVIPHRIHHVRSDKRGDPYGPHLGWLGSYLAIESTQKLNINMSATSYETLKQSLSHIGFWMNDYVRFRKTASVETLGCYLIRSGFAQVLWISIFIVLGGIESLVCWYAAIFIFAFMVREFNWRGHGGNFRTKKRSGWEFDLKRRSLNQRFYGFVVGEWHDNHHKYSGSANTGFLPGQIDFAFQLIKLMAVFRLVNNYADAKSLFCKEFELVDPANNKQGVIDSLRTSGQ